MIYLSKMLEPKGRSNIESPREYDRKFCLYGGLLPTEFELIFEALVRSYIDLIRLPKSLGLKMSDISVTSRRFIFFLTVNLFLWVLMNKNRKERKDLEELRTRM